jgi:hypothetical protein
MRPLTIILAFTWALANLFGAGVILVNGVMEKTSAKPFIEQSLMLLGGLLVVVVGLLLIRECWEQVRTGAWTGAPIGDRPETGSPAERPAAPGARPAP